MPPAHVTRRHLCSGWQRLYLTAQARDEADCWPVLTRFGPSMASGFARTVVAVLRPLLQPRAQPAPRALSTLLLGPLRPEGAGAAVRSGAALPWLLPGVIQPCLLPTQGFKTKGVLKKRCKDCYLVKRRGRWYIYCKTNPRHKQRQL